MIKFFVCFLIFLLSSNITQAHALDYFRNVIESKKFTLKYTVESHYPDTRINLTDSDISMIETSEYIDNTTKYIAISNDDDFYVEYFLGALNNGNCILRKNDKVYFFSHNTMNSSISYKNSDPYEFESELNIKPKQATNYHKIFKPKYIGSMWKAINALSPDNPKAQYEKVYHLVKTGTNSDGLTYFDLKADNLDDSINELDVIRYYFNGDKLVKIMMGRYTIDAQNNRKGQHEIITIEEFSPTPEQKYLSLPSELNEVGEIQ